MYQKTGAFVLTLTAAALLFSSASHARDDDRRWHQNERHDYKKEGSKHRHDDRRYDDRSSYKRVKLTPAQYRDLNRRMEMEYWKKCTTTPYGRYYDCSPGRYNTNYRIGRQLPRHTVMWDVPSRVKQSLPRAHQNTRYVWVDRDILLIDRRDNTVIDIIRAIMG